MASFLPKQIIAHIYSCKEAITFDELEKWCRENKCENFLNDSVDIYKALIEEHNAEKNPYPSSKNVMQKENSSDINILDKEVERQTLKNEKMWIIYDYIKEKPLSTTIMEVARWCCQYGYWGVFRKNSSLFLHYIAERNKMA